MADADAIVFNVDSAGLAEYLASPEVTEMLSVRGRNAIQRARDNSPVLSGAYRDSIELYDAGIHDGRRELHLIANIDYSAAVEWGGGGRIGRAPQQAHHVLASVIDSIEAGE